MNAFARFVDDVRHDPAHAAGVLVMAALVLGYLYLSVMANLDLIDGRFALNMDERITYDGVQQIYHPDTVSTFIWSVMDGNDHRYGRSLWNASAVAAYLPTAVFGDAGQIFATRMLQSVFLLLAFVLLARSFASHWALRSILLCVLLALPYTSYFMTIPKPEPLQTLFLAVFLIAYKNHKLAFGRYWIWLGLAFGTKISILSAILIFVAASMFYSRLVKSRLEWHEIFGAAGYTLFGLSLAVPILVAPVLAIIAGWYLVRSVGRQREMTIRSQALALVAWWGVVLVLLQGNVRTWVSATFLNTTHGADQESIKFMSWVDYLFDTWLVAPVWLGMTMAGLLIAYLIYNLVETYGRRFDPAPVGLVLAIAGFFSIFLIFITAHRLWGHYLFPGSILILVGLFSLIDVEFRKPGEGDGAGLSLVERVLGLGSVAAIATVAIGYWTPSGADGFHKLSQRSATPEYQVEIRANRQMIEALETIFAARSRTLRVSLDPILLPPTSNKKFIFYDFWGPYVEWEKGRDVLAFSAVHTPDGRACVSGSPNYQACLEEGRMYARYVIGKNEKCSEQKCYRRYAELENGGEILVLERR